VTGRRRVRSARGRIVGWTLLLVVVALAVTVGATRQILADRLDDRIDRALDQEVAELRTLARLGVDPVTRRPFADARELMRLQISRSVPGRNDTMFSIVDGAVDARSGQPPPVRLDQQPELVADLAATTSSVLRTAGSPVGAVRYAAVPVTIEGSSQRGVFVVATFRDLEAAEIADVTRVMAGVGVLALAVAGAGAWLVAGRVLRPVRDVQETAQQITESDLTRRIAVSGDDEIAQLARTFNTMLDRLEAAFAAQRQFVDDASHELRTPLTIVRGHLELIDDDPAAARDTLALVADELDRMSRLVDDLLVLARADRPDFLRLGPVDLAALTDELVAKAEALGNRRWQLDASADVHVLADRHRLTQAVVQLAQNAVQHTSDGDVIGIGSAAASGLVRLWVRDTGPGVPPADRERIFARFARRAPGRGHSEGAGLGLAIVAAIAAAHGGAARVVDTPGGGATFVLELPAVPAAADPALPADGAVTPRTVGAPWPPPTVDPEAATRPVPTAPRRPGGPP
jgi:signal transduction histidine kinase